MSFLPPGHPLFIFGILLVTAGCSSGCGGETSTTRSGGGPSHMASGGTDARQVTDGMNSGGTASGDLGGAAHGECPDGPLVIRPLLSDPGPELDPESGLEIEVTLEAPVHGRIGVHLHESGARSGFVDRGSG